jgi:hypothetical protein
MMYAVVAALALISSATAFAPAGRVAPSSRYQFKNGYTTRKYLQLSDLYCMDRQP